MSGDELRPLVGFLLARVAEDEARARDFEEAHARAVNGDFGTGGGEWALPTWFGVESIGFLPARVLAECEAKRRIVARMEDADWDRSEELVIQALLAIPYSDHPDFRDEWRS